MESIFHMNWKYKIAVISIRARDTFCSILQVTEYVQNGILFIKLA